MRTVQITVDAALLRRIDKHCGERNRSAFFRKAAELLLEKLKIEELERRDREGYRRCPVTSGEFDVWQTEQVWPD
ncbi:MAG TPA: ribbon-helix-helix protein, CopG family [Candidatus Obscuribacterales bacterium]